MLAVLLVKTYYIIWLLLTPFIPLVLIYRAIQGKERFNRINERIGIAKIKRPKGELVWINAASVGELRSTIPLIKRLIEEDLKILITTVTVTSAIHIKAIVKDIGNKNIIHQFSPIDHPLFINFFINHWKPSLLLLIESEIWPHIIIKSFNKKIPLILLQGRMSKKSYKKWLLVNSLSQYLYKKFSLIVSQDLTNGNRYKILGGNNVLSGINLKNGIKANHMNYKEEEEIIALTNKRPILLFASIHDKIEDQAAIASHIEAKKNNADLLTIIVPRHIKIIKNLISLVDTYKLKTKIRSKKQEPDCNTEIYIADTIGELGSFMKISDICFVGGSLSPKGGHNLIEPALEKCAIIYGPDVSNHANTSEILLKENAAIQINNINELKTEICKLMNDKKEIKKMVDKAYNVINNIPDPSYILLNQIKPYLKAHGE